MVASRSVSTDLVAPDVSLIPTTISTPLWLPFTGATCTVVTTCTSAVCIGVAKLHSKLVANFNINFDVKIDIEFDAKVNIKLDVQLNAKFDVKAEFIVGVLVRTS